MMGFAQALARLAKLGPLLKELTQFVWSPGLRKKHLISTLAAL